MPTDPAPPGLHEFRVSDVSPGSALLTGNVVIFNDDGRLCATQAACPHRHGPLHEGTLDGSRVTCPWHGSQFDVCTGAVLRGPAQNALETYSVTVEGDVGRVHVPVAQAGRSA